MIKPMLENYLGKKFIEAAHSHKLVAKVKNIEISNLKTISAYDLNIHQGDPLSNLKIESISLTLNSLILSPSIKLNGSLYKGQIECIFIFKSIFSLFSNSGNIDTCKISNIKLDEINFPDSIRAMGSVDSLFSTSSLDKNAKAHGELRIINGYFDPKTLNNVSLIQMIKPPEISDIKIYTKISKEDQKLNLNDFGFESSLGFIDGSGSFLFTGNWKEIHSIQWEGSFKLSPQGMKFIAPWIPLINQGVELKKPNAKFRLNKTLNNVSIQIF